MLDIWFVAGIALGTIVTGFCAIGSFRSRFRQRHSPVLEPRAPRAQARGPRLSPDDPSDRSVHSSGSHSQSELIPAQAGGSLVTSPTSTGVLPCSGSTRCLPRIAPL